MIFFLPNLFGFTVTTGTMWECDVTLLNKRCTSNCLIFIFNFLSIIFLLIRNASAVNTSRDVSWTNCFTVKCFISFKINDEKCFLIQESLRRNFNSFSVLINVTFIMNINYWAKKKNHEKCGNVNWVNFTEMKPIIDEYSINNKWILTDSYRLSALW